VVVIVALALAPGSGSDSNSTQAEASSTVSVAAPTPSAATIDPCAQVESALPVQLDGNNPRAVEPSPDTGAAVVAWGNPPIIFHCGVDRPKELVANSTADIILAGGVNWLPVGTSNATVFTAVDRSVYIQLTVPKSYAQPPIATVGTAIASVLPAICDVPADVSTATPTTSSGATSTLCTRRS
jgi:hypothetical protein